MLEQSLTYTTTEGSKPGIKILTIEGPFLMGNMFELQAEMRALHPDLLIVDLTAVPYMDSAGLGVLVNSFVSAQTHKRRFVLAGVNERILSLFELTKVNNLLPMCVSVDAAQKLA